MRTPTAQFAPPADDSVAVMSRQMLAWNACDAPDPIEQMHDQDRA
jgi:hypothetical protein